MLVIDFHLHRYKFSSFPLHCNCSSSLYIEDPIRFITIPYLNVCTEISYSLSCPLYIKVSPLQGPCVPTHTYKHLHLVANSIVKPSTDIFTMGENREQKEKAHETGRTSKIPHTLTVTSLS